jgi:hypothetical protein
MTAPALGARHSAPQPLAIGVPPRMNKKILLLSSLVLAALLNTAAATLSPGNSAPAPTPGEASVDEAVAYVLNHYHFSREPLEARLAGKIFDEYL